jgi:hypothetical protein
MKAQGMPSTQLPATLKEATASLAEADDAMDAAKDALARAQTAHTKAFNQLRDRLIGPAFAQARIQSPWRGDMRIDGIGVYHQKVVVSVGYYSEDDTRPQTTVRVEFDR